MHLLYVFILHRTPTGCYRQATMLKVEQPNDECGRPQKIFRDLSLSVTDTIPCPLKNYGNKLDSYSVTSSISWYKVSYCHLLGNFAVLSVVKEDFSGSSTQINVTTLSGFEEA